MVQSQLPLAVDAGLFDVHVQTECTAVQLRCADVDQVDKSGTQRPMGTELTQFEKSFDQFGRMLVVVDSWIHCGLQNMRCNACRVHKEDEPGAVNVTQRKRVTIGVPVSS